MSSLRAPKPECSYGPACYRRNVEHFQAMMHRHLDDLLDKMPEDKPLELPDKLDFPCTSRALLRDQLAVVRAARKMKSDGGGTSRANVQGKSDDSVKVRKMSRSQVLTMMEKCGEAQKYVPPQGGFAEKHRNAAPYYVFFPAVQDCRETWSQKNSVTLSELLDKSLGKIVISLHLNFVVDVGWLCTQYLLAEQNSEMTVFCGERSDESPLPATIKIHTVKCPNRFGCHHSKLSILQYEDKGIRVIVSTANLYKDDWNLRTQGLWMSQHLPRLPISAGATDGESKTGFKQELLRYLSQYKTDMDQWRAIVARTDFSSVDVALVCSVPGYHRIDVESEQWGLARLESVLKKHVEIPEDEPKTTIVAQASSIGNLGTTFNAWLGSQLVKSMAQTTRKNRDEENYTFKAVYPTIDNYKTSYDMSEAANCLCYSQDRHLNQRWFQDYLYKWSANCTNRSRAVPHIKTFTRISKDGRRIWWFVLGSANLSKAAWGYRQKEKKICVLNYEASVVFLPKFVTGSTSFPVKPSHDNATPVFPIPYDLPLRPYRAGDKPFVSEFFQIGDEVFEGRNVIKKQGELTLQN